MSHVIGEDSTKFPQLSLIVICGSNGGNAARTPPPEDQFATRARENVYVADSQLQS
jgi:hypothetical protein